MQQKPPAPTLKQACISKELVWNTLLAFWLDGVHCQLSQLQLIMHYVKWAVHLSNKQMKTYYETITTMANAAFDKFVKGGFEPWENVDFALIAYIYGKPVETVRQECTQTLYVITASHYGDL